MWARDWRRVMLENLTAYGGEAVMLTVTGPGADVLPWDRSMCVHDEEQLCSGRYGCVVEEHARQRWNATFPARFKRLNDAAKLAATRELAAKSIECRGSILCMGKEAQKRGILHAHIGVGIATPAERAWAWAYMRHLNRLAPLHSFGYVDRKLQGRNAREMAAYLSRYFVSGRGKAPITEAVLNPELPSRPLYVSPKLTYRTRVTMRNLRRVRHWWAWDMGIADKPKWRANLNESIIVACISARRPVPASLAGI